MQRVADPTTTYLIRLSSRAPTSPPSLLVQPLGVQDENTRLAAAIKPVVGVEAGPVTRAGSRTRAAFGDLSNTGSAAVASGKPAVKPVRTAARARAHTVHCYF